MLLKFSLILQSHPKFYTRHSLKIVLFYRNARIGTISKMFRNHRKKYFTCERWKKHALHTLSGGEIFLVDNFQSTGLICMEDDSLEKLTQDFLQPVTIWLKVRIGNTSTDYHYHQKRVSNFCSPKNIINQLRNPLWRFLQVTLAQRSQLKHFFES